MLTSKTWSLSSYGLRDDKKHKLTKGVYYHLNLYASFNLATFRTSCPYENIYGKYRIDNQGKLLIWGCSDQLMQGCSDGDGSKRYREGRKYINAVIFNSKYRIQGNELILTSSDGKQLFFTGVTNRRRMNFFEQLLDGFVNMVFTCKGR